MHKRNNTLGLLFQISVPALCLVLSSGCAAIRGTLHDTHATLTEVVNLTEFYEGETAEQVYTIEERILDSCQPLLSSAHLTLFGEDVPLLTWVFSRLGALFSFGECQQAVIDAGRELDALRNHVRASSAIAL